MFDVKMQKMFQSTRGPAQGDGLCESITAAVGEKGHAKLGWR